MAKINASYLSAVNLMVKRLAKQRLALTFDLATVLNSTRQFLVVSGHYVGETICNILNLIFICCVYFSKYSTACLL
jgi:hypothetical protein